MMRQRLRTNLIALLAISLTLTFVQTPQTPAFAAVCQGEAAYPPDLPDCLDPVVAAQQEAATAAAAKAAADKVAADNAAAERAAAAAAQAIAERAAAAQAAAKAAADKAAADALAEQIRQGNLAAAATAARAAAQKALEDAETARLAKVAAEAIKTAKIEAEAKAQEALANAQKALADAQAKIAQDIADAKAESDRQKTIALEKKRLADAAAAKFAEERIALDRAVAEKEAARQAKEAAALASASATSDALQAYLTAGGTISIRIQVDQFLSPSIIIKKQELLTQPIVLSYLKIQKDLTTVFVSADELDALRSAYLTAKGKSDADRTAANLAIAAKVAADQALADKKAIADAAQAAFIAAALAKTAADNAAAAAAAERTRLENVIKDQQAAVLARQADITAAQAELDKKAALLSSANSAATSLGSAATTLESITTDGGNSASLASQALAAFQNVATASNNASNAAADAAAAAERESAAQAAAVRARQEADAAAALAARTSSGSSSSGANVTSAETRAAQEAANRARELERQAQEAARLAAEAKAAEEKAFAEKKEAEEVAAKAKAAADKASADALAKEEAKRKAARNQIARDRAISKNEIQKIQDNAQKNTAKVNKSATDIKSAYELALDQLVKVNKNVALLKEKENIAFSKLNQTKSELLTASNSLQYATQKQGVAVAKQAEANYATIKIQNEIESNKKAITENDKSIKVAQNTLTDATKKYERLSAIAQSATTKVAESKKAAESAYNAWQSSLNTTKLTASLTFSDPIAIDNPQTANAQSALSKLKEQYDLAQKQYEIEKVIADRAVAEASLAKQVLDTAKSNLETRIALKATLFSKIEKLTTDLSAAKNLLKTATAAKVIAVANYTKSENEYAIVKSKFSQSEITYQGAKADTKYEYENATSQNNQVVALRKLSEFSKNSVKTAKDVLNSIQDEAKKLENSQIVGFLNDNSNLATIPLPVFIIGISAVSVVSIFAYLRRRQRRSKMALIDQEILERLIKKNLAKSKPKVKSKSGLKTKP